MLVSQEKSNNGTSLLEKVPGSDLMEISLVKMLTIVNHHQNMENVLSCILNVIMKE